MVDNEVGSHSKKDASHEALYMSQRSEIGQTQEVLVADAFEGVVVRIPCAGPLFAVGKSPSSLVLLS